MAGDTSGKPVPLHLDALKPRSTSAAIAEMVYWLSSPRFDPGRSPLHPVLLGGALGELSDLRTAPAELPVTPPMWSDPPARPPAPRTEMLGAELEKGFALAVGKKLGGGLPVPFGGPPQLPARIDRAAVLGVEQRYGDPDLGDGVARFAAALVSATVDGKPVDPTLLLRPLVLTREIPAFDRIGRLLPGDSFDAVVSKIATIALGARTDHAGVADRVAELKSLIQTKEKELPL